MNRVRMLIHFGIEPYLVFDGDYLPSKALTEKDRAARRKEARENGLRMLKHGKTSDAYLELQKAVDVTPEMARLVIEELKKAGIQYVVAPYEADSQLAYLEKKGIINGIVSEDSDLLVFGARALITKLDQYGECVMIRRDDFTACREVSLVGWSDVEFRRMAILSGCDYLENINKMGLKTAYRLIRKYKSMDRLIRALQFDGQYKVPKNYLQDFEQAERTFLHQWVYCPIVQRLINYTPIPEELDLCDLSYIGSYMDPDIAVGVARGDLDPHTKEALAILPTPSRARPFGRGKENIVQAQTPDLKKNKSIESFFKPARTPLAELSPNLFSPSPTQQQLLERHRHSGSWSASPAPASHTNSVPQVRQNRSSLSADVSRTRSAPLSAISTTNPSKRRRVLCGEDALDVSSAGKMVGTGERSKFFSSPKRSKSSPARANRVPPSSKRPTEKDSHFWSDDSIEDVFSQLPDPSNANETEFSLLGARKPKKNAIPVFEDGAHILGSKKEQVQNTDSQESNSTFCTDQAEKSQDFSTNSFSETQATSIDPESQEQFDHGERASRLSKFTRGPSFHGGLLSKFSYPSGVVAGTRSPIKEIVSGSIGHSADDVRGERAERNQFSTEAPEIEDSAWECLKNDIVVSASSPVEPQERVPSVAAKGSEDLLVPNSEDEWASLSEEDEETTPRPAINLRKFAFMT